MRHIKFRYIASNLSSPQNNRNGFQPVLGQNSMFDLANTNDYRARTNSTVVANSSKRKVGPSDSETSCLTQALKEEKKDLNSIIEV